MSPPPFCGAFIQLNVECTFVWGYDSRVAQAAKRATRAHQLSIRHFRDLNSELLNVELLKADAHWRLATGDFEVGVKRENAHLTQKC
jgi:hypothetical protein